MCVLIFNLFITDVLFSKEINRYRYVKYPFLRKTRKKNSWKENLQKCTSFEEQKDIA